MVSTTPQPAGQVSQAQAAAAAGSVDMAQLKEQAQKLELSEAHNPQVSAPASAQHNGVNGVNHAVNGYHGPGPHQANTEPDFAASQQQRVPARSPSNGSNNAYNPHSPAYSQTGDYVGAGPVQVNANPSDPSLPPPHVAKNILCRYFPNCKYGDGCAFAHGALPVGEGAPEGMPNGVPAVFGSPSPEHAMPFYNPYAPSHQPSLPPVDYYGAPIAPGYYGPPPPGAYHTQPNPYAPMPFYSGFYPGPPAPSPHQNGLDGASVAPLSPPTASAPIANDVNGEVSSPPPPAAASSTVSPETPAFVPMAAAQASEQASSAPPAQSDACGNTVQQQQQPSSANGLPPQQNGQDLAARPPRGPNGLNGSTNNRRERGGPYASSARTSIKGGSSKKPYQIACTFFLNNACRLGDGCQFSHIMPDGSDAKMQARNIVGLDGRVGEISELEDFKRSEAFRKERMAASGAVPQRPRPDSIPRSHGPHPPAAAAQHQHQLPPHPARYVNGHAHDGAGHVGGAGYGQHANHHSHQHQPPHHKKPFHGTRGRNPNPHAQSAPAPRLPSNEDFPALSAGAPTTRQTSPGAAKAAAAPAASNASSVHSTPASTNAEIGSVAQSGQSTPQTPASTHEAATAASLVPKLVSSFASAAARGASAAPPPPRPTKKQQGQKKDAKTATAAAAAAPNQSEEAVIAATAVPEAAPPAPPAAAEAVAA